ncbi:hypothetical protein AWB67_02970 [Caballeronia terrestris]|jgi:hypothetical protein|uniref:RNA-binding protein n=1 Tax=Caballeronia terrestris TaxID=1226301 RepID=A0A158IVQ5_9BURK|nr:RNA-binding protein [Caballeronia terrestris]SAL60762.1 hypothetical protein AWB67_02970 [Caballeronia terrestris]
MAELWIGNVADDTSDEEIKEFLIRYGFPAYDEIQRVPGAGSRPAVLLTFNNVEPHSLRSLEGRIHNLFWKNRTINVNVVPPREEE